MFRISLFVAVVLVSVLSAIAECPHYWYGPLSGI